MGNCGVGIAPCRAADREIAMRDLVNVEAIPFDVLQTGHPLGMGNLSPIHECGATPSPGVESRIPGTLTPFRHYVMGEASMERAASAEETQGFALCWRRRWMPERSAFPAPF